jgi:hypothetical protein
MPLSQRSPKNSLIKKIKRFRKTSKKKKQLASIALSNTTIALSSKSLYKFVGVINLSGYLLLTLTLLDYSMLIFPLQLFDPTWELNIIGQFVESVWAILLGFLLIFFRLPKQKIKSGELKLLTLMSWLLLLTATIYCLSVPLIISDTVRLDRQNFSQLNVRVKQQEDKIAALVKELEAISDEQLTKAVARSPLISPTDSSDTIRKKLFAQLQKEKQNSINEARLTYQQQKNNLFKTSAKWAIGSLLSGLVLIAIWHNTKWSNKKHWMVHKHQPNQTEEAVEPSPSVSV